MSYTKFNNSLLVALLILSGIVSGCNSGSTQSTGGQGGGGIVNESSTALPLIITVQPSPSVYGIIAATTGTMSIGLDPAYIPASVSGFTTVVNRGIDCAPSGLCVGIGFTPTCVISFSAGIETSNTCNNVTVGPAHAYSGTLSTPTTATIGACPLKANGSESYAYCVDSDSVTINP